MTQVINGIPVHQAARAYSDPDKFISTWEGEPGNPSPLGVMVNYNGGYEARNLRSKKLHGEANKKDVTRFLAQAEQIWPGIAAKYTGKALVSNWLDDPLARSAFTSPSVGTMISSGAPAALDLAPRKAKEIPIGISPEAASLQGLEPE